MLYNCILLHIALNHIYVKLADENTIAFGLCYLAIMFSDKQMRLVVIKIDYY